MGVLPYIKKEDHIREASVFYNDNSIYSDVFRLLRTKLVYFNQENPDLKVFMVTSSNAAEGKTLITTSLALSFQKTNKKVLLVEGDLWKPGIKRVVYQMPRIMSGSPGYTRAKNSMMEPSCFIKKPSILIPKT